MEFLPNVRVGLGQPERFKSIKVASALTGSAEEILSRWNYMLQYALYLQHSGVKFGGDYKYGLSDNNCRSAVISTLRAVGIEFQPELYAHEAGTKSGALPLGLLFDEAAKNQSKLNQLIQDNQRWQTILKADWIREERYIGPAPYVFLSMR